MVAVTRGFEECPSWAPALGWFGASLCMILASWGSAWGTWRAGLGVCNMGIHHPAGIIKNIVPIVMAGVLGIYGLIVAVIISQAVSPPSEYNNSYSTYTGYTHLAAGLCCGLSCLAAGGTIGILGDAGVQAFGLKAGSGRYVWTSAHASSAGAANKGAAANGGNGESKDAHAAAEEYAASNAANNADGANKLYVGMLIMLIFSEALALYGLIVALILSQHNYSCVV